MIYTKYEVELKNKPLSFEQFDDLLKDNFYKELLEIILKEKQKKEE